MLWVGLYVRVLVRVCMCVQQAALCGGLRWMKSNCQARHAAGSWGFTSHGENGNV